MRFIVYNESTGNITATIHSTDVEGAELQVSPGEKLLIIDPETYNDGNYIVDDELVIVTEGDAVSMVPLNPNEYEGPLLPVQPLEKWQQRFITDN